MLAETIVKRAEDILEVVIEHLGLEPDFKNYSICWATVYWKGLYYVITLIDDYDVTYDKKDLDEVAERYIERFWGEETPTDETFRRFAAVIFYDLALLAIDSYGEAKLLIDNYPKNIIKDQDDIEPN